MDPIIGAPQPTGGAARSPQVFKELERLDNEVFALKDKDRNGYLSRDEFIPSHLNAAETKGYDARFDAYDKNNDGKLSKNEFKIGRALARLAAAEIDRALRRLRSSLDR